MRRWYRGISTIDVINYIPGFTTGYWLKTVHKGSLSFILIWNDSPLFSYLYYFPVVEESRHSCLVCACISCKVHSVAKYVSAMPFGCMYVHSKSFHLRLKAKLGDFWESGHFHVSSSALPPHFMWHIVRTYLSKTFRIWINLCCHYSFYSNIKKNISFSLFISFTHF